MATSPQEALELLGRRLEARGFRYRVAPYFGPAGIVVFTPPVQARTDESFSLSLIERGVFLYPSGTGWEARVTLHGGPHWTRQAESVATLEDVALEALRASGTPPSQEWRSDGGPYRSG